MGHVVRCHFNQLPFEARERLVACLADRESPSPTLAEHVGGAARNAILGVIALLGAGVVAWRSSTGYGELYGDGSHLGPEEIAIYLIGLAALLVPLGFLLQAWLAARRLPFRRGTYVLGGYLVDATSETIRVEPVLATRMIVSNHVTDGVITGATITFHGDGHRYVFHARSRLAVDHAVQVLDADLRRATAAAEAGDLAQVRAFDPLFEARDRAERLAVGVPVLPAERPRALPRRFVERVAPIAALLSAIIAAPGAWALRNRMSDDAMFANARTAADLRAYVKRGKRHVPEARVRLHRVTLSNAKARESVTALRDWRREFPDAAPALQDEARAATHELFVAALDKFRRGAGDRDPRAIAFVEKLLAHAEANDSPPIPIRFRPPQVASLQEIDGLLAAEARKSKGEYDFAPLVPHFNEHNAQAREVTIADALGGGFKHVFPRDMLELVYGARMGAEADPGAALIEVSYEVSALFERGDLVYYVVEKSYGALPIAPRDRDEEELRGHLYVGIEVHFEVTMRVAGAEPYTMELSVQPPDSFRVETDADDADIYRIMADNAFVQLRTKLEGAFFGAAAE